MPRPLAALLIALAALPVSAAEPNVGSVTGTFVLDGPAPQLPPVAAGAGAAAICGAGAIPNETVLVDPATGGLANVFIWLPKVAPEAIPAAAAAVPQQPVVLDQKGCVFLPHAFVIRAGQDLKILNADPAAHNVHTYPIRGQAINVLIGGNDRVGLVQNIKTPESLPVPVKCDIHPWMQGFVLAVDHPYAAVSDGQGKFTIENLPPGDHTFRLWHEKKGYVDRSYKVTVKAGETTDLGKIKVAL